MILIEDFQKTTTHNSIFGICWVNICHKNLSSKSSWYSNKFPAAISKASFIFPIKNPVETFNSNRFYSKFEQCHFKIKCRQWNFSIKKFQNRVIFNEQNRAHRSLKLISMIDKKKKKKKKNKKNQNRTTWHFRWFWALCV